MIVTACGIFTSVLTALLLAAIESKFGVAIYSFAIIFVPVGAVAAGLCAASGYYFGGRLFQIRPTRTVLFGVVAVAVMTYFLIGYLNYSFLQQNGQPVSKTISFGYYMQFMVTHQKLEFYSPGSTQSTGDLGRYGYAIAVFQVLGFAAGGVMAYGHLRSAPYCQACARYLPKQAAIRRYTANAQNLQAAHAGLIGHLRRGDSSAAADYLSSFGSVKGNSKTAKLNLGLKLWKCSGCPEEFVEVTVRHRMVNRWTELEESLWPGGWDVPSGGNMRQYLQRKS